MATSVLHHIDTPTRWDDLSPNVIVRGWCVDEGGDTVVAIELVASRHSYVAPVGLHRPDVAAALGHAPGSERSGFCMSIPADEVCGGRATFRARHRDGSVTDLRCVELATHAPGVADS